MASVNKVILLGHLGRDPETKNFDNGGSVCSFTMATTESYWDKEKAQRVDLPTEWHNIRITRPGLIKVAQQYLHKGSQVYLEGSLRTRQYQTKEGETKYFTEVFVNDLILTGGKPNADASSPSSAHVEMPAPVPAAVGDDDLPF
jgi:single-strand DNA-binding protein